MNFCSNEPTQRTVPCVINEQYSGFSVSAGVGVPGPVEAHVDIAETKVVYLNVYEKVELVCEGILDW